MTHTFLRALEAPHHFAVGKTKAQRSSEISPGSHGCSGSALSSPQTKRPLSNTWEERGTWPSEGWGGGLGCACSHPDTRPGVISEAEGPSHPGLGAGLRALQGLQRLSPPRLAHVCPRSRSGGGGLGRGHSQLGGWTPEVPQRPWAGQPSLACGASRKLRPKDAALFGSGRPPAAPLGRRPGLQKAVRVCCAAVWLGARAERPQNMASNLPPRPPGPKSGLGC